MTFFTVVHTELTCAWLMNYAANKTEILKCVTSVHDVTHSWLMLSPAPGVWDQILHSVPHSGHAKGFVWSHEEGKVPDAGDDVRSRTGAPTEGEEKERTTLSPRVALVFPRPLHYTPYSPQLIDTIPPACLFMYFSFESLAWLGWFCTPKTPSSVTRSSLEPVGLQPTFQP